MKTYLSTRLLLKQKVETSNEKKIRNGTLSRCWSLIKGICPYGGLNQ